MIDNIRTFGEWRIYLTMIISFLSVRNFSKTTQLHSITNDVERSNH